MSNYGYGSYASPGAKPAYAQSTRLTVRRVRVGSAAKVMGVVSALIWAILGLIFLLFGLFCGGLSTLAIPGRPDTQVLAGSSLVLVLFYIVGIVFSGVGGAISGALYAWIYNLASNLFGGLQIEVG